MLYSFPEKEFSKNLQLVEKDLKIKVSKMEKN